MVGLTIAAAVITFALMLLKRKAILQELDSYQQLDQRDSQ
jgi:heme exporter protein D